jgi:hypothetical protein
MSAAFARHHCQPWTADSGSFIDLSKNRVSTSYPYKAKLQSADTFFYPVYAVSVRCIGLRGARGARGAVTARGARGARGARCTM